MKKFNHQFDVPRETSGEWNNETSMTTPDMAMSLQEMSRRFVQGRPIPKASRPMHYSGDEFPPQIHKMDEMDIVDLQRENDERIAHLKEQEQILLKKMKERKEKHKAEKEARKAATDLAESVAKGEQGAALLPASKSTVTP